MKHNLLRKEEDSDPISVVSNLFDVAMVFAVALMVALVSRYNMTEVFSQEDFTMVKNPGKENMEIITKVGEKINRYTPSEDQDNAYKYYPCNSLKNSHDMALLSKANKKERP